MSWAALTLAIALIYKLIAFPETPGPIKIFYAICAGIAVTAGLYGIVRQSVKDVMKNN